MVIFYLSFRRWDIRIVELSEEKLQLGQQCKKDEK